MDEKKFNDLVLRLRKDKEENIEFTHLPFNIEMYNKKQKKRKNKDKAIFISLSIGSTLPIWQITEIWHLSFAILPFFSVSTASILILRSNAEIKDLDLGLTATEFQEEELRILRREYATFKKLQWVFYPMLSLFAVCQTLYGGYKEWEYYVYPLIHVITMTGMMIGYRWAMKHYQKEIRSIEKFKKYEV